MIKMGPNILGDRPNIIRPPKIESTDESLSEIELNNQVQTIISKLEDNPNALKHMHFKRLFTNNDHVNGKPTLYNVCEINGSFIYKQALCLYYHRYKNINLNFDDKRYFTYEDIQQIKAYN